MFRKIFALLILTFSILSAHGLNIFVYDENNTLYIQSYFTKSSPCKNCEVTIKDDKGRVEKLFTDGEGKASLVAFSDTLTISVDGGMGHYRQIEYAIKGYAKNDSSLSTTTWYNIPIALAIMAIIFFVLLLIKRKK
jgi:hypothetical protein